MAKEDVKVPRGLFVTADGSIVVMDHVCMTRWTNIRRDQLSIYFAVGPHISLERPEGEVFEKIFLTYHAKWNDVLESTKV